MRRRSKIPSLECSTPWGSVYCHPQTNCFVLSELFSVARHVGRSKPGSKPIQLYVRLNLRQLGQQAYHVWLRELFRYLCSNSSSRLFPFLYPLGYQSAQFCQRALYYAKAVENSFTRVLNPHGGAYIVIHRQTVSFYQNSYIFAVWYICKWKALNIRNRTYVDPRIA